jgi:hypothetical protein
VGAAPVITSKALPGPAGGGRTLAGLDPQQALELLLDKTPVTASNREFLQQIQASVGPHTRQAVPSAAARPGHGRSA